jgi:hypothetical protein
MRDFGLKDEGYVIVENWDWICLTHWESYKSKRAKRSLEGGVVAPQFHNESFITTNDTTHMPATDIFWH